MDSMILFEREVLDYFGLPSIPKRVWDGVSSFDKGIAILCLRGGLLAYGVCAYDADVDKKPRIVKVFGQERFIGVDQYLVIPSYMSGFDDVVSMDLDDESKKKAELLLVEADELERDGIESSSDVMDGLSEWVFPEIKNREQAIAWLKRYNKSNGIKKGRIPAKDETLKLRLYAIYSELNNKSK